MGEVCARPGDTRTKLLKIVRTSHQLPSAHGGFLTRALLRDSLVNLFQNYHRVIDAPYLNINSSLYISDAIRFERGGCSIIRPANLMAALISAVPPDTACSVANFVWYIIGELVVPFPNPRPLLAFSCPAFWRERHPLQKRGAVWAQRSSKQIIHFCQGLTPFFY
jgi:hypothetical protein